jgi:lipopolysaccharide heptosyltransferase I
MGQGIDLIGALTSIVPERLADPVDRSPITRVLIIKMSSLGDVTHALPVAVALKRALPAVRITWTVEESFAALLDGHPDIDRVVVVPDLAWRAKSPGRLSQLRAAVRAIRSEPYDVVLDLQGLAKSASLAWLSRGRVRLARAKQREGAHLVSRAVAVPSGSHAVDEYLELARFVGAAIRPVEFHLSPQPDAVRSISRLLLEFGIGRESPLIVINPSASGRWKNWPAERWAAVADPLTECGTVVLIGTGQHCARHAAIHMTARRPLTDLTGRTTLAELVALLDRATLHVTHDTGSAHVAAALGRRVVAVYGPTSVARLAPYGQAGSVISHGHLCGTLCPAYCLHGRRCLTAAAPSEVVAKARDTIANG